MLGLVSIWMGDRLGTPGAVGNLFGHFPIGILNAVVKTYFVLLSLIRQKYIFALQIYFKFLFIWYCSGTNYSGLLLIWPPRDRPFMSLISGWN